MTTVGDRYPHGGRRRLHVELRKNTRPTSNPGPPHSFLSFTAGWLAGRPVAHDLLGRCSARHRHSDASRFCAPLASRRLELYRTTRVDGAQWRLFSHVWPTPVVLELQGEDHVALYRNVNRVERKDVATDGSPCRGVGHRWNWTIRRDLWYWTI